MPYALLLFVAMPIIEIAVLLRVGSALGWLPTLAIVVLTALLGTAMLRQQGLATLNKARQRMGAGEMPAQQLLEGLLLLVGGLLLLTPGFVTDAFGFFCLVPPTRQWLAKKIASHPSVGFGLGAATIRPGPGRGPGPGPAPGHQSTSNSAAKPPGGNIIDADYERVDD